MLTVGIEGDDVFGLIVEAVRDHAPKAVQDAMYRLSGHLAGKVRDTIIRQTENWPPLSPRYAKWKAKHGLDERVLRATGQYVQSIVPRRVGDSYVVSASPNAHVDPRTGKPNPALPMTLLSIYLEYGFDVVGKDGRRHKMPPRPHFRPVYREFQRRVLAGESGVEAEVWDVLQKEIEVAVQGGPR